MKNSQGKIGEKLFEFWAQEHGWKMTRHQPPTKVCHAGDKTFTVQCKSQGVSDYTGYEMVRIALLEYYPIYRAVEVKEANGDTMPCSRLDKAQRDWMAGIDSRCAFVAVAWMDRNPYIEVFKFRHSGSYKKGEGIK